MPAVPPYINRSPSLGAVLRPTPGAKRRLPAGLSHRARILDRTVLEKLVQVLVFACAYERNQSPRSCVRLPRCSVVGATNGSKQGAWRRSKGWGSNHIMLAAMSGKMTS